MGIGVGVGVGLGWGGGGGGGVGCVRALALSDSTAARPATKHGICAPEPARLSSARLTIASACLLAARNPAQKTR